MNNIPIHILLADDDDDDRLLFTEAIAELELNTVVQTVVNGLQLMEFLHSRNTLLPDILFLDLNMPLKGGLQCLKEIRCSDKFKNIVIAIYSTSDNPKDVEETFLDGANIYLTKPNDFNTLKKLLNNAISSALLYSGNSLKTEKLLLQKK